MTLKAKIRNFIEDNFLTHLPDFELADDQSLMESDIIDSTGVIELIAFIEADFGLEISDHEVVPSNLDSVNKIVTFIQNKLNPKPKEESVGN